MFLRNFVEQRADQIGGVRAQQWRGQFHHAHAEQVILGHRIKADQPLMRQCSQDIKGGGNVQLSLACDLGRAHGRPTHGKKAQNPGGVLHGWNKFLTYVARHDISLVECHSIYRMTGV